MVLFKKCLRIGELKMKGKSNGGYAGRQVQDESCFIAEMVFCTEVKSKIEGICAGVDLPVSIVAVLP
jgi:hypothetical protein